MPFHLHSQRLVLCGWERSLRLNFLFSLSFALILSILSRTLFAWFLIYFGIMLSCICIFLSCLHVFCLFLFGCLVFILFYFQNRKKGEKPKKYKNNVCLCILVLVYLGWPLKQSFLNFVFFISKWALWLVFVMSKIKWSLILNTHITLFERKA